MIQPSDFERFTTSLQQTEQPDQRLKTATGFPPLESNPLRAHESPSVRTAPLLRCARCAEIRDKIEIVHTSEYGNFLTRMVPVFLKVIKTGQPQ